MKKTADAIGGRNLRKGFTRRARDLVQHTMDDPEYSVDHKNNYNYDHPGGNFT